MMDATHLPMMIGLCVHCHLPLYADAPVHVKQLGETAVAHVACEVHEHRGEAHR